MAPALRGFPSSLRRPPLASQAGWQCQGMLTPDPCPTGGVILGRVLHAASQASHRIARRGPKQKGLIIGIFYLPSSHPMHFSSFPFLSFPPLTHPYFPFLSLLKGEWWWKESKIKAKRGGQEWLTFEGLGNSYVGSSYMRVLVLKTLENGFLNMLTDSRLPVVTAVPEVIRANDTSKILMNLLSVIQRHFPVRYWFAYIHSITAH